MSRKTFNSDDKSNQLYNEEIDIRHRERNTKENEILLGIDASHEEDAVCHIVLLGI